MGHTQIYYLTMFGPGRGERVAARVSTDDRAFAERIFGCGPANDKGFGFNGLYTEEEVSHMFRPATEIAGTYNPAVGSCEYHRDYHNAALFEVINGKAYRIKNDEKFRLDLSVDNTDFDFVRKAMSVKTTSPVVTTKRDLAETHVDKEPIKEDTLSFLDALDDGYEPVFDDEIADLNISNERPVERKNLSAAYDSIDTVRKPSKLSGDNDYISEFDAKFYSAHSQAVNVECLNDSKEWKDHFAKTETVQPVKRQGQSIVGLIRNGNIAEKFSM